jgi:hypothetical protein
MINVNEITAKLARLPDAALQQYAQMHKDDPYMVSLAISESNRRKAVRQAGQSQGMAPQGSVVDQMISGIAALPAENMQSVGMADGGIVAFAEGGRPSRGPTVYDSMIDPRRRRRERELEMLRSTDYGIPGLPTPVQLADLGMGFPTQPEPGYDSSIEGRERRVGGQGLDIVTDVKPASLKEDTPSEKPKEGSVSTRESLKVSGPASVQPARTIEELYRDLKKTRELVRGTDKPEEDEIRKRISDLSAAQKEGLAALIEKDEAMRPKEPALAEREKKLREAEERAPEDRQQAISEALVMAGLGMLAGESPYAGVNIGKGAIQGMQNYQASMKDLKAAAEKREELLDKIELGRRAEAQGDADRAFKYGQLALKADQDLEQAHIKFLTEDLKYDRDTAAKLAELQSAERRAELSAQTQLNVAQTYADRPGAGGSSDVKNYLASLNAERNRINSAISLNKSKPQFDPKVIEEKKQLENALSALDSQINALRAKLAAEIGLPTTPTASAAPVSTSGWGQARTITK